MKPPPFPPAPFHPWQNVREIEALWSFVAARPHRFVVEIGSLLGGTLWYWAHLPDIEALASVDLLTPYEPQRSQAQEARALWHETFGSFCRFEFCEADSQSQETADLVMWGHPPIDFLFIDGDHSYEGIRADCEIWRPHVADGGVIAFHDTWPNVNRAEPGVKKWVDEFRHYYPAVEFTYPDGAGITAFTKEG